jgi:hypothetical protein
MEGSAKIGRWSIRFDPEATRALYARSHEIACTCWDCANFQAAGVAAFPPAFLELLERLGIDPAEPAELCHYGISGNPMPTQGWFHFVGQLDSGADAWRQVSDSGYTLDAEPFPDIDSIGFSSRLALVPEAFEGQPLVQLEFEATIPWVTAFPT